MRPREEILSLMNAKYLQHCQIFFSNVSHTGSEISHQNSAEWIFSHFPKTMNTHLKTVIQYVDGEMKLYGSLYFILHPYISLSLSVCMDMF